MVVLVAAVVDLDVQAMSDDELIELYAGCEEKLAAFEAVSRDDGEYDFTLHLAGDVIDELAERGYEVDQLGV